MIIYIHGFGSSGFGIKARLFRDYFKSRGVDFIAPSLSFTPDLAIDTLQQLVNAFDDVKLMGSSLGGYYALYLAKKYGLKAVLINPSIHPYDTLASHIGQPKSYFDDVYYEWNEKHIDMLKKYDTDSVDEDNFLLMLQKGDETLDYKEAIEKLPNAKSIVEDGGSHSFDNIERHFRVIENFLTGN